MTPRPQADAVITANWRNDMARLGGAAADYG